MKKRILKCRCVGISMTKTTYISYRCMFRVSTLLSMLFSMLCETTGCIPRVFRHAQDTHRKNTQLLNSPGGTIADIVHAWCKPGIKNWSCYTYPMTDPDPYAMINIYHLYTPVMLAYIYHTWIRHGICFIQATGLYQRSVVDIADG